MGLSREIRKTIDAAKSFCDLSTLSNPINPKISANIICKDNIKSIELCLQSIKDTVDEIVVIDGGSKDGTLEILEKYNCKVIHNHDWQGYSHQRNLAIENSIGDWILVLDSDEFLSHEFKNNLSKLVNSKVYSGYRFYRRWIQPSQSHGPTTSTDSIIKQNTKEALFYINATEVKGRYKPCLRLFRKSPETRFKGPIHEAIHGLEKSRIKKFDPEQNYIYHLDVAINSFEERFEKTLKRNQDLKGSGHPEEYLPELFNFKKYNLDPKELVF